MLPRPLYTLPLPNAVLQAFRKAGYKNYEDLLKEDGEYKEQVVAILHRLRFGLSELKQIVTPPLIDTAGQLLQNEALIVHIPTFSQSIDSILGGGIRSGVVFQICGGPGSAKTQFLLQLCVNAQLPACFDGLEGASVFIDTDSGFSVSRLREIAEGAVSHCTTIAARHQMEDEVKHFTVESILNNVFYIKAKTPPEIIAAVEQTSMLISKNRKIKCVALDSIIFPFLTMNNNTERTRILFLLFNKLAEIAEQYEIAVVFTNHLTTRVDDNSKSLVPALGDGLSHRCPNILLLAKNNTKFTAVLSKSPCSPEMPVPFEVTRGGIRDISETDNL